MHRAADKEKCGGRQSDLGKKFYAGCFFRVLYALALFLGGILFAGPGQCYGQESLPENVFYTNQDTGYRVLIEDGAHVIGTRYKGKWNGSIADMTTLSFHPVKTVTCGEGGAVLTNSKEYYKKLLLYRAHGITRDPELLEHEPDGPWYYEQLTLGMNYRMTDMQAALLMSQLDKLPMFSVRRKEIVRAYDEAFLKLPQIIVQKEIPESDTTRHLYILRLDKEKLRIDRKQFFEALEAENVCCNVHYIPTYYFPYYEKLGYKRGLCPKAEKLYEEIISLPLYYAMSDRDVQDVICAVTKIAEYYKR